MGSAERAPNTDAASGGLRTKRGFPSVGSTGCHLLLLPFCPSAANGQAACNGRREAVPFAIMAHKVRAILLARATAASLRGRRSSHPSSQGLAASLVGLAWRITAIAPATSSWRSRSLPARLMPPRRWPPPVDRSLRVRPSQAAKWRGGAHRGPPDLT